MIYFVYDSVNNAVKIGKSKEENLYSRLYSLQTGNVTKLDLLGVMTGYTEKESELHLKFDKYRIREEWFEYVDEIANYIETNRIEYEVKCSYVYNREKEKIKDERKKDKRIVEYLEKINKYFELDSKTTLTVSEIKEYLKDKNVIGVGGNGILPVSILIKHFGLKETKTKITTPEGKKTSIRVVKGLKMK